MSTTTRTVGLDVTDLRLPAKESLRKGAQLSFRAVELATVEGDVAPAALSSSGRRHLTRFIDGLGLNLAALVADVPGLRLTDPQTADERVERTLAILQLARDLKVPVVTASAGALTHPQTGDPSPLAMEALQRIGEFADLHGVRYAIRPTCDGGDRLVSVLEALRCPALQVCLDPAAMVMSGVNPLSSIERLIDQVALFHARDGTAGVRDAGGGEVRWGRETALGEGDVDIAGVLAALEAADYHGPYILRRTDSRNPVADLQLARDSLNRLLSARG